MLFILGAFIYVMFIGIFVGFMIEYNYGNPINILMTWVDKINGKINKILK